MSGFIWDVCDVNEECLMTLKDLLILVVLEHGSIVLEFRPWKGDLKAVLGGLECSVALD